MSMHRVNVTYLRLPTSSLPANPSTKLSYIRQSQS